MKGSISYKCIESAKLHFDLRYIIYENTERGKKRVSLKPNKQGLVKKIYDLNEITNKSYFPFQNQCIMGIVDYIKKNPRASEEDIAKAVQQYVAEFQAKVEAM